MERAKEASRKKAYDTPVLSSYGNITAITKNATTQTNRDSGASARKS